MGSHSVTCHPTQVSTPRLNHSHAGRYSIYLPRRDGKLRWPRWISYEYIVCKILWLSREKRQYYEDIPQKICMARPPFLSFFSFAPLLSFLSPYLPSSLPPLFFPALPSPVPISSPVWPGRARPPDGFCYVIVSEENISWVSFINYRAQRSTRWRRF